MSLYYLYLEQGGGCDYTIGCGSRLRELELPNNPTQDDISYAIRQSLDYVGIDADDPGIAEVLLFKDPEPYMFLLENMREERRKKTEEEQRRSDEAELKRLQKKLGKK